MKSIAAYIRDKKTIQVTSVDEKTIFFLMEKIVEREYGRKGIQEIVPKKYSGGKLIVRAQNAIWANEVCLQKAALINALNALLGSDELKKIQVVRN